MSTCGGLFPKEPHPFLDPFDLETSQICITGTYFLVGFLLPCIAFSCTSLFGIGCPACCCCGSCFPEEHDPENDDNVRAMYVTAGGQGTVVAGDKSMLQQLGRILESKGAIKSQAMSFSSSSIQRTIKSSAAGAAAGAQSFASSASSESVGNRNTSSEIKVNASSLTGESDFRLRQEDNQLRGGLLAREGSTTARATLRKEILDGDEDETEGTIEFSPPFVIAQPEEKDLALPDFWSSADQDLDLPAEQEVLVRPEREVLDVRPRVGEGSAGPVTFRDSVDMVSDDRDLLLGGSQHRTVEGAPTAAATSSGTSISRRIGSEFSYPANYSPAGFLESDQADHQSVSDAEDEKMEDSPESALEGTFRMGQLFGGKGRVIRKRGLCECCIMNCGVLTVTIIFCLFAELFFWRNKVYDPHWAFDEETKVVIIASAGGGGHIVAAEKLYAQMTSAEGGGWAPFANALPIANLKQSEVEIVYTIPPACERDEKDGHEVVTKKCHRRSWLQLNFISLALFEMVTQRVFGDQGWTGRDDWDAAQASGGIERQAEQISMQKYATLLYGWAFLESMKRYLRTHPNLRLVVSVQPLATVRIYEAVEAWNTEASQQAAEKMGEHLAREWETKTAEMNAAEKEEAVRQAKKAAGRESERRELDHTFLLLQRWTKGTAAGGGSGGPVFPGHHDVLAGRYVADLTDHGPIFSQGQELEKLLAEVENKGVRKDDVRKILTRLQEHKQLEIPVKGVHFALQLTDPPNANNFFFVSMKETMENSYQRSRGLYYHVDVPYPGRPYHGTTRPTSTPAPSGEKVGGRSAASGSLALLPAPPAASARGPRGRAVEEEQDTQAYMNWGFTRGLVELNFRYTDGTLKPAFQKLADKVRAGEYDPERVKPVVLWGGKTGKTLREQEVFPGKAVGSFGGNGSAGGAAERAGTGTGKSPSGESGIVISENEKVVALSFGSKAAVEASLGYLRFSIREASKSTGTPTSRTSIFVFCVKNKELIKQVTEMPLPSGSGKSVRVFALGLQGADAIAALYNRANTLIIRPGGVTAFEIRAAGYGIQNLIAHSERPLYEKDHVLLPTTTRTPSSSLNASPAKALAGGVGDSSWKKFREDSSVSCGGGGGSRQGQGGTEGSCGRKSPRSGGGRTKNNQGVDVHTDGGIIEDDLLQLGSPQKAQTQTGALADVNARNMLKDQHSTPLFGGPRAGGKRVCTRGMLPHELGNVGWLADTLGKVTTCDLKRCFRIVSGVGGAALPGGPGSAGAAEGIVPGGAESKRTELTEDEDASGTPVPCLQPFDQQYEIDSSPIEGEV